jgi:hypothetical protein
MTGFLLSPGFLILLAVAAVTIVVLVLWLLRDGPSARRAGMIDLTGVKPSGTSWDWPQLPEDRYDRLAAEIADERSLTLEEARSALVRVGLASEPEPERRPSFGV